jgi:hypothetical protein
MLFWKPWVLGNNWADIEVNKKLKLRAFLHGAFFFDGCHAPTVFKCRPLWLKQ